MDKRIKLKKEIVETCIKVKSEELAILKKAQKEQLESANQDDIDKADMVENPKQEMMEEIQMKAQTLDALANQIIVLKSIRTEEVHQRVGLGSIVVTNHGTFLVAVAQEKFKVGKNTYLGISRESPLYKKIADSPKDTTVHIGEIKYEIQDLF